MKNYFLSLIVLIITVTATNAQTANAIIFSENGEQFTVTLNGALQNVQPTTNIKLSNLNAEWYKMKINFINPSLGLKDFNLGVSLGNERNLELHKKNNGEYSLRMISEVPISQAAPTQSGQIEVVYGMNNNQGSTTTTITQQTTTTNMGGNPQNGNVNIGMSINGAGVGISVSGVDSDLPTSTTTITTTTTTTGSTGNYNNAPQQRNSNNPPHYIMPDYNGPIGCPYPMSREDFIEAKSSISSKDFEDTKMTVAKLVVGNNCLTCKQVKEIMMLFTFENTKLDFAKFSYGYTFDIGNYYKLNDAFTFSSSVDELNKYINSRNH